MARSSCPFFGWQLYIKKILDPGKVLVFTETRPFMTDFDIEPASFRDPDGFIFIKNGTIYRQVNNSYKNNYEYLMSAGLYDTLIKDQLLIPHQEVQSNDDSGCYKWIQPQKIPFISYPYEWSFSQLKDAALVTLQICEIALDHGMILRDACAYNIQFFKGKPIFIDTLSFDRFEEGKPWNAYQQFCQQFLAPLALMNYSDLRMNCLLKNYINGIPLDLTSKLLPMKTKLNISMLLHIHMHAKQQKIHENEKHQTNSVKIKKQGLLALLDSLKSAIIRLKGNRDPTIWENYYNDNNYSKRAMEDKYQIIQQFVDTCAPVSAWDLGANIGVFSRIPASKGIPVISFDIDPNCVELNYLETKKSEESDILPLYLDLCNPTPGIGWGNTERKSLHQRGPTDLILALGLIHHITIANNIPLYRIAQYFGLIGNKLIIEFIPKEDSQVQKMLSARTDIFASYSVDTFEKEFGSFFKIIKKQKIADSERIIYLMEK